MRNHLTYLGVFLVTALLTGAFATAQTTPPANGPDQSDGGVSVTNDATVAAGKPAPTRDKSKPAPRFKPLNDVVKGLETVEGLITLYRDAKGPNQDPEKLMARISKSMLDTDLLFATSISSGGSLTGFMWDDYLIRWQLAGDYLKMMTPDVRYVTSGKEPVSEVIERTYKPRYLAAVPIAAMAPNGDVLIDLNRLLKTNIVDVPANGGVRPELSTWGAVKNFPDNTLIEAELAVGGRSGGTTIGVTYAFRRLPREGTYKSRVADPRVGYFLTARQDWTKAPNARTTFERYINRWHLEKQDPSLALSPPKEPILIIIEKTVPIQWRRWVREGIEEWNKAFEKIGFDQAIVVQQQTDANEYADYDPEDARYNFFRWITSGRAFAMGPSRADPRTGQILDADIIFDDAFVRAYFEDFDLFAPSSVARSKGPAFRDWVAQHPEFLPNFLAAALEQEEPSPADELWDRLEQHLHERGRCLCTYATGMQQQIAFGQSALLATGGGDKKIAERYIGEAIKQVVTHEVGHILGLRHNFKASSWLGLDEIRERRLQENEPLVASVMDYNPIIFFADDDLEQLRHFVSPVIGPYDYWAIEYGYAIPEGQSEEKMLTSIAGRGSERALRYATDEDTMWILTPDPEVERFDVSSNQTAWAKSRVELADKMLTNITDWALEEGDPYYYLRRAYDIVWWERARNFEHTARLVGGQYFNRDHKGDPDAAPPFVHVEPSVKRAALQTLADTVFDDDFYAQDADLLNYLAPDRWRHWGTTLKVRLDYPIHERIKTLQSYTLLDLLAAPVFQRIYDAELKTTAADKFTVAEYIQSLRDMMFADLDQPGDGPFNDANPMISSIHRNLQRDFLMIMLAHARLTPDLAMTADIQSMIRLSLRELSDKIAGVANDPAIDFASRAHLWECRDRIDRVLNAQFEAR